jgi:hypothetical protein
VQEELLGARLRAIEFPEAAGLALRVIDRHRSEAAGRRRASVGRRSRLVVLAAALAVLIPATALAAPGGREALSSAPLLGPVTRSLFRLAGLDAAGERVTPLQGEATSSGETISLTGGYADNQRTVVIVHVEPARSIELPVTLTVDGARAPLTVPVVSPTTTGDVVLVFGPIVDPSLTGDNLALHVTELGPILTPAGPAPGAFERIPGDWTLRFSLTVDRSAAVPAPRPGRLGDLDVSFTASRVGTDLQVSAQLHGASIGQLEDMASDADAAKGSTATPGPRAWYLELVDESGHDVRPLRIALSNGATPRDFTDDTVWSVPAPGTYLLVARWEGSTLVRAIVVR